MAKCKHKAPMYGLTRLYRVEEDALSTDIRLVEYEVINETSLHMTIIKTQAKTRREEKINKEYKREFYSTPQKALQAHLNFLQDERRAAEAKEERLEKEIGEVIEYTKDLGFKWDYTEDNRFLVE